MRRNSADSAVALPTICLAVLMLSAGVFRCGPAPLNEERAKPLIAQSLQSRDFRVDLSRITPLMAPSATDYRVAELSNDDETLLRALITDGFVAVRESVESYPIVTGEWEGQTGLETIRIVLQMSERDNTFSGKLYRKNYWGQMAFVQNVNGNVTSEGRLIFNHVDRGDYILDEYWRYVERESEAYLEQVSGVKSRLSGTPTRNRVQVKTYEYTFSPEAGQSAASLNAGSYSIDKVSNLHLITDTTAVADFSWTASLNKLGSLLYGGEAPNGLGKAEFLKKPDGTWTLGRVRL